MEKRWIKEGFESAVQNTGAQYAAKNAEEYILKVNDAIDKLNSDINSFAGFQTNSNMLQGDIAEFWHGDTFNINAAINESSAKAIIDRSHELASPDIFVSDGADNIIKYGLKYYKDGIASAKAQSKSIFQRFNEYRVSSGQSDLTFDRYLADNGFDESMPLHDPIYSGQVRIIPSDQLETAKEFLRWKIAKEQINRPELAKKYQDTLDLLETKVKYHDGTESVELSREASKALAERAKDGTFDARELGINTEKLIKFHHALAKGLKAGQTAGMITMVLKVAPQIYKCIEDLISSGVIDEDEFKELGIKALSGYAEGFFKGFVTGTLVTACESGLLSSALKSVDLSIIGALVVVCTQTIQDAFFVAKGKLTKNEMLTNVTKNFFVAACGVGLGLSLATLTTGNVFAYMLGNFVGSIVGAFIYNAIDNTVMALAVNYGWTFFGIVEQNYELPDNVLKEIGVDIFEYDEFLPDEYEIDEFSFDEYEIDEYRPNFITVIRRGVIGVHRVGYIQD